MVKKPVDIKNIICWVVAALMLVFIVVRVVAAREPKYTEDAPRIVLMGDSIFANSMSGDFITSPMEEAFGYRVKDFSLGGTCMAYLDVDGRIDNSEDAFCMSALTQAITSKDFKYQNNAHTYSISQNYFAGRLEELEQVDFTKVKILLIEHMLNDYHMGTTVECGTNLYNEYTYEGALRGVVSSLLKKYPDLIIILVTPAETWYEGVSSHEKDFGGGTIDVYIAAQRKIAEEFGLKQISLMDVYREDSEANRVEYDWKNYTNDGIHPQEEKYSLIALKLIEELEQEITN